ncbi:hypothetical protein M3Y94_00035900 [Aphelenchoides besseyi]|nr:hypothetical protein M3Y94_00035900 [Aphelenchoides besseyi]
MESMEEDQNEKWTYRSFFFFCFRFSRVNLLADLVEGVVWSSFSYVNVYLLNWTIDVCSNPKNPRCLMLLMAICMIAIPLMKTNAQKFRSMIRDSKLSSLKDLLAGLVYKKMFRLAPLVRSRLSASAVDSMINRECDHMHEFFLSVVRIVMKPLNLVVSIYLIINLLGTTAVYCVSLLVAMLIGNMTITKFLFKKQTQQNDAYDKRQSMTADIFNGIRVIKLSGWEDGMTKNLEDVRNLELRIIRNSHGAETVKDLILNLTPYVGQLIAIYVYVFVMNQPLTLQLIFLVEFLTREIEHNAGGLPRVYKFFLRFHSSMKKVTEFLNEEELVRDVKVVDLESPLAIDIKDADFGFDTQSTSPTDSFRLLDINLQIPKNSLVAVVGEVGSGKTALLSALISEMHRLNGQSQINAERVAYVTQQPWIQNMSLRDNILFGDEQMDEDRYNKVVRACALIPDLKLLADGDSTLIGERGVNLSGGQKARVALARAVYQQADVYLLDDVLSAVDNQVSKHIFTKVIGPKGLLNNRTRVMATNVTSFLKDCDLVIILKDGRIEQCVPFQELKPELIRPFLSKDWQQQKAAAIEAKRTSGSSQSEPTTPDADGNHGSFPEASSFQKKEKRKGSAFSFWTYSQACGLPVCFTFLFVAFVLRPLVSTATDFYMSQWTTIETNQTSSTQWFNYQMYMTLDVADTFCYMIKDLILAYGSYQASSKIYHMVIRSVVKSPMSFFENTPIGEVSSRLDWDISQVDHNLSFYIDILTSYAAEVLRFMLPLLFTVPFMLTPFLPLFIHTVWFARHYKSVQVNYEKFSRKFLSENISRLHETWYGITTIRSLKAEAKFTKQFAENMDRKMESWLGRVIVQNWLSVRLEFVTNCLCGIFVLLAVYFTTIEWITVGMMAMILKNCTSLSNYLTQSAEMYANGKKAAVSMERLNDYVKMTAEPIWQTPIQSAVTPVSRSIEFRNVSLRYGDSDKIPMVLRNLSFRIESGEKVGIVGRTGAGKTSITSILFRLVEATEGEVLIGEIDYRRYGTQLRELLTIIPQDPILFYGTIRSNLDPWNRMDDTRLRSALRKAHILNYVDSLNGGLDHEITEGGQTFSVGQRQLLCLARALLRRSQFLILDEATASVDLETDRFIQKTIRENFANSTILTIAHRLDTIRDFDRVMVMEQGRLIEFDRIDRLLQNENSRFARMVRASREAL